MKIAISGANGYIGAQVVKTLLTWGHKVIALDFQNTNLPPQAVFLPINVLESTPTIYQDMGRPDVFLHLAWKDGFVHNSPAHLEQLSAHARLLRHLLEGGLKQLAVMGTMHEVGYHEGAVDENTPCRPISQYGIAKNALRGSSCLLARDHQAVWQWLRAFYIYGNDIKSHSVFTKILQAAQAGKQTFPFTSGKNKYDFIPVQKLAEQIAAAVVQSEVNGIINCCSGRPVSLAAQVNQFIEENHLSIKLDYGAFPERPYDSPAIWGNADKINQIMNRENRKKTGLL